MFCTVSALQNGSPVLLPQVRTASKRPPRTPACTPAKTPGRRALAASALSNRLRALGTPAGAAATEPVNGNLFGSPLASAPSGGRNSIGSAASGASGGGRSSTGADAALCASMAMASAPPAAGCDLSPGLLTLPGAAAGGSSIPMPSGMGGGSLAPPQLASCVAGGAEENAAGWRGATEAQLREMERAWDEYKVCFFWMLRCMCHR